eukprot:2575553-Amphidinium_carterae.1
MVLRKSRIYRSTAWSHSIRAKRALRKPVRSMLLVVGLAMPAANCHRTWCPYNYSTSLTSLYLVALLFRMMSCTLSEKPNRRIEDQVQA